MRSLIPSPPPGIYPGKPMDWYLSLDAWGASDLREMLEGPEACYHRKYEAEEESSAAQDFGTLAHMALLEPSRWPPKTVAWVEGPYNKNPGRAEKTDAEARGFTVYKPEVRDGVTALVKRAREHPRIKKLLDISEVDREVVAIARCPQTGLMLKARCDLRARSIATIADLKTSSIGSDREAFENQLWSLGYYASAPHYAEVFSQADPAHPIDTVLYLVVPQSAPYVPRMYDVDELTLKAGSDLNDYLRRRVAECVRTKKWKDTNQSVETVGLSAWRLERIQALLQKEVQAS